jgi:arylformamidase
MRYYDITVPISPATVTWPSDPPVRFTSFKSVARGDRSNVLKLELGTHAGSHVDAPNHIGLTRTVDRLPLDSLIGPCIVIEAKTPGLVPPDHLRGVNFSRTTRVLFKTANSARIGDDAFHPDFVALAPETARLLARRKVRLVGIDAMSVDPKGGSGEAHRTLLGAGVILLENINLSRVPPGRYQLICLPLNLTGADGAPARVVLAARDRPATRQRRAR